MFTIMSITVAVQEVEVCLAEPSMFWSAGEDGIVRQYDSRAPDQKAWGSANVLVDLMTAGECVYRGNACMLMHAH